MFTWNWVDEASDNYDGAIAINYGTIVGFFETQLTSYAQKNCFKSSVECWLSGLLDIDVNYSWKMVTGEMATITSLSSEPNPTLGDTALSYSWNSSADDKAGMNGDRGEIKVQNTYNLTVQFTNNQVIISQHLVLYLYASKDTTSGSGNIVDKTMTDTYTLGFYGTAGSLSPPITTIEDNSNIPHDLDWFSGPDVNISTYVTEVTNPMISTASIIQNLILPGGDIFTYDKLGFSNNLDLVSQISYSASS